MCGKIKVGRVNQSVPSGYTAVYIGRPKAGTQSPLGNPYYMCSESNRNKVCDEYQVHLDTEYQRGNGVVYDELMRLVGMYRSGRDIMLTCFCAPKRCHGDSIKQAIEQITFNMKVK